LVNINENYLNLQDNYLFSTISKKVKEYIKNNPDKKVINLGIGDVTLPITKCAINSMFESIEDMENKDTFKGYGPEQGYEFLRENIIKYDYNSRGISLEKDEIFISDGAKCDIANISELFSKNNIVAITEPVYPVYLDVNVIADRSGKYDEINKKYEKIVYLSTNENNNFIPDLPNQKVDIIYLCNPNNPTGTTLNKSILEKWVNYAINNDCLIFYDSAYEAFISNNDVPHSIYEINDSKKVAIEFRSYSKTAGFTGLRCSYTVVPKEIKIKHLDNYISLNYLWNRRQCTKFNGVSYITQKAANSLYSDEGIIEIKENINYYMNNAKILVDGLKKLGYTVYGGVDAPYIWLKIPNNISSWDFFDIMLHKYNIIGTPRCRIWSKW
jgi:LL-diaminopimelate aminotransferase